MHLKDANQLLDHFYLPFESGWMRLDTGVIHIGVRTHMIGVTPAMIDWWLGFVHPLHGSCLAVDHRFASVRRAASCVGRHAGGDRRARFGAERRGRPDDPCRQSGSNAGRCWCSASA